MKPETLDFLPKAHRLLGQASTMQDVGIADAAARSAYLAGFHAAQATIFERLDRVLKTHSGVHSEFARVMRHDDDFPQDLRGFLAHTFEFKAIADYGVGPDAEVTSQEADEAMTTAARLIAYVETKLAAAEA